jgi:Uma2 family endonuclease
VEDYYRMGEIGIFASDARVELIDGEVIDMPPIGSRHAAIVDTLAELLIKAVAGRGIVRTQGPIALGRHSEPLPDLALLKPRAGGYFDAHPRPENVLLVIEVADTSLRFDRDVKAPLYAEHAVPEVWVIAVEDRCLTRYRDPLRGAYTRVDEPDPKAPLEVAALPAVRIDLSALFPSS